MRLAHVFLVRFYLYIRVTFYCAREPVTNGILALRNVTALPLPPFLEARACRCTPLLEDRLGPRERRILLRLEGAHDSQNVLGRSRAARMAVLPLEV